MNTLTKKSNTIQGLADGKGLVDTFGNCYHKEADGIRDHQNDRLISWKQLEHNYILLDNLDII